MLVAYRAAPSLPAVLLMKTMFVYGGSGEACKTNTSEVTEAMPHLPVGWVNRERFCVDFVLNEAACVEKGHDVDVNGNRRSTMVNGSALQCRCISNKLHF